MTSPGGEGAPRVRNPARATLSWQLAALAAPLAAFAAMAGFSAFEVDPAGAAEGRFLALVMTGVLVAMAALAPPPALEVALGSTLAAAAVWALPPGPTRGAAIALIAVAGLAVAGGRRMARTLPELSFGMALPLAVGFQLLARGDLLLPPSLAPRSLIALFGLPIAAAGALAVLARRYGGGRALLAGASAALLAPGWTVASTAALVALAAGSWLAGHTTGETARPADDLATEIDANGFGSHRRIPRWMGWAVAMAVLSGFIAWEPRAGLLAVAAGLALWRPDVGMIVAAGLAVLGGLFPAASAEPRLAWWIALPLAVPAFLVPERARWRWAVSAALLAVASLAVPGPAAAAAPLALAALAVRPTGATAAAQRAWTAVLTAGVALAAAYPWLREVPLETVASWLGTPWIVAAVASVAVVVMAAAEAAGLLYPASSAALSGAERPGAGFRWRSVGNEPSENLADEGGGLPSEPRLDGSNAETSRAAAGAPLAGLGSERHAGAHRRPFLAAGAAAAVVVAVFLGVTVARLPRRTTALLPAEAAVQLDPARPVFEASFASQPVGSLVVDSALANGASLPPGTPIATLRLISGPGPALSWTLAAGRQTGEWAARRPDVAASSAPPPPAWISFVAGDFFGQRYRGIFPATRPGPFSRLRVERAPGLPADVAVALHRLELRR